MAARPTIRKHANAPISHNVYYVKSQKVAKSAWHNPSLDNDPQRSVALFNWTFDSLRQTLTAPSGWCITVKEIATSLQDRVHCRYTLSGPWAGWKIRGRVLIGPNGQRVTPEFLKRLISESADTPNDLNIQQDAHLPSAACTLCH
jgi:hypothetical protein